MSDKHSLLEEIERILREAGQPLSSRMLLYEIKRSNKVTISGKTPLKTINARITEDIKEKGKNSVFMRLGRAIYAIREQSKKEYEPQHQEKKYSTKYENRVLVFPSEFLDKLGYFQGIRKDYNYYSSIILNKKYNPVNAFYMNRRQAENDYLHKQIVSYVIVKSGDSILRQTRGARTSVSGYLRGQYSIGFGGHVEYRDALPLFHDTTDFGYIRSVQRELQEELGITISSLKNLKTLGVLNDESVQEGRKHLAYIHLLEVPTRDFKKNERWINDLLFVEIRKLNDEFEDYEYWSKLCILSFFGDQLPSSRVSKKRNFSLIKQSDLVLIVGYVGSGKSEACALLEKEFNYKLIRCSRIMQEIIGCGPIEEIGRDKLQDEGYKFITQNGGHERLAQGIVDFMRSHPSDRYVLDGLRYPETLVALQTELDRLVTVLYVDTMNDSLYRNHKSRDSSDFTFANFMKTVYHPVERKIAQFRPLADITVYNHGSLHSYLNTLTTFFREELQTPHG